MKRTHFRAAWERRLEPGAPDDVVMDLLEHALEGVEGEDLDEIGLFVETVRETRRRAPAREALSVVRSNVRASLGGPVAPVPADELAEVEARLEGQADRLSVVRLVGDS